MASISVIIPTGGRPVLLQRLLEAAVRAARAAGGAEILVIDTGRQPGTREICGAHAGAGVRCLPCKSAALHAGRHEGARVAAGDVLLFADDDILPGESWITSLAAAFADPRLALAGGACLPDYEAPPPAWAEELWQDIPGGRAMGFWSLVMREGGSRDISPFEVYGCNFAIRKSVLRAAGGFHPDGVPPAMIRYRGDGETAVSQYVQDEGLLCRHIEGAAVKHHVSADRMTFPYMLKRSFAQGVSASFTKIRRQGVPDERNALRRAQDLGRRWRRTLRRGAPPWMEPRRWPADVMDVVRDGYRQGFRYHQDEVGRDRALLGWVKRQDFWDAGLPGD